MARFPAQTGHIVAAYNLGPDGQYELYTAEGKLPRFRTSPIQNLQLSLAGSQVILSWTSSGVDDFKVYSSPNPDDGFQLDTSGVFSGDSWTAPISGPARFYYVTAVAADGEEFIMVEGGTFHNGSSNITLSGFYIGRHELTQSEYQLVMGTNPSYNAGQWLHPVETVSWFDAIEYCNRRSLLEGLIPCYSYGSQGSDPDLWPAGWNDEDTNHSNVSCSWASNGYRLPTEMEWMFAAKGGNESEGYNYSGSDDVDAVAWHSLNSESVTHAVESKAANELGLYDMSGNVYEWVWDIYDYYLDTPQEDPTGPDSGTNRVRRGGAWSFHPMNCEVSRRNQSPATTAVYYTGFRLCRADYSFAQVEGGTFHNGTANISISSFLLDPYELTQAQYELVMGSQPSYFSGDPSRPVETASWFDAIEYCNRRSIQEGFIPCYSYGSCGTNPDAWPSGWNEENTNHTNITCTFSASGYRLPTEAEWEFAARGGNLSHNYTYSGSNDVDLVAWHSINSQSTTHPVRTKAGNELDLYDMSGNVFEWVWDIYATYPSGSQTDPTGPPSGDNRVKRGGGWSFHPMNCEVSRRNQSPATTAVNYTGFRVCRSLQ